MSTTNGASGIDTHPAPGLAQPTGVDRAMFNSVTLGPADPGRIASTADATATLIRRPDRRHEGPATRGTRRARIAPEPGRRRTVAHDPRTLRLRPSAGPRWRPPDP